MIWGLEEILTTLQHQRHQQGVPRPVPHPLAVPGEPQPAAVELQIRGAQAEQVRLRQAGECRPVRFATSHVLT